MTAHVPARVSDIAARLSPLAVDIQQPTHTIPCDCPCSWSVVRTGPGLAAVSRLRFPNALCPYREHRAGDAR